jgi:hypothetical protein
MRLKNSVHVKGDSVDPGESNYTNCIFNLVFGLN